MTVCCAKRITPACMWRKGQRPRPAVLAHSLCLAASQSMSACFDTSYCLVVDLPRRLPPRPKTATITRQTTPATAWPSTSAPGCSGMWRQRDSKVGVQRNKCLAQCWGG
jgi:hypothetical protein